MIFPNLKLQGRRCPSRPNSGNELTGGPDAAAVREILAWSVPPGTSVRSNCHESIGVTGAAVQVRRRPPSRSTDQTFRVLCEHGPTFAESSFDGHDPRHWACEVGAYPPRRRNGRICQYELAAKAAAMRGVMFANCPARKSGIGRESAFLNTKPIVVKRVGPVMARAGEDESSHSDARYIGQ